MSGVPAYSLTHDPGTGPVNPTSRPMLRAWLVTGVAVVGFGLIALAFAAYFGVSLGLQASVLALLFAVIPLGIVIPTFLWLDRYEAEPTRLLVFAFLWGALVAAAIAMVLNTTALVVFQDATQQPEAALMTTGVMVAPIVEEGLKGLLVLLIWRLRPREFDGITDGLVYAGVVAAGFAFTENIAYLGQAFTEGGGSVFAVTFVVRGLFSPFAHPMFTAATGIGIGIAATARHRGVRFIAPIFGYLVAVLAHAIWNFSAFLGGSGALLVYALVEIPAFIVFLSIIAWARRREARLIGLHLMPYADVGWFAPGEVAMLSSMPMRREARIWARANQGAKGLASMRAFQDAASELALLRARMSHSTADATALQTEAELLNAVVARRREFIGGTLL